MRTLLKRAFIRARLSPNDLWLTYYRPDRLKCGRNTGAWVWKFHRRERIVSMHTALQLTGPLAALNNVALRDDELVATDALADDLSDELIFAILRHASQYVIEQDTVNTLTQTARPG